KTRPVLTVGAAGPVRVRAGGVTTFPVTVRREGFDEPVTLRFEGLPRDVGIDGGAEVTVPAGRGEVTVTLHADEKARPGDVRLTLAGTSGMLREVISIALTIDRAASLKLRLPPEPLELRAGETKRFTAE